MPIYNGIEFIDQSVKSIINQKYEYWELLIGINGHEHNSEIYNIAKKYENTKIKVYDFYYIKGKSDTLNEMVKRSKYELISLLDVDDIWLPNKLLEQIKYTNYYDVIGTHCKYFGDLQNYPEIPFGDLSNFNFLSKNPIINSSCLVKKELCFWNNKYDKGCQDYHLWLSLWKRNKRFYNLNTVQVLHRIHKNSAFNAKNNNSLVPYLIKEFS
jgi:glycosyltransferase involved in cell wall biosynthesis